MPPAPSTKPSRVASVVDVPVAVGFRTPAILLPTSLADADETLAATGDLDQIVLHEYAHLERYDDWTNALQLVLVRAFWFNPFVAFFAARIALEREIASDDWVVARTGRAHRYATCLWKLVEAVKLPTRRVVAPGALFSPRQITVRIEQLLDSRRSALQAGAVHRSRPPPPVPSGPCQTAVRKQKRMPWAG